MKVIITGNRKYSDEHGNNGYRPQCLTRYLNLSATYEDVITAHLFGGAHEDTSNLITINTYNTTKFAGVIHVSPAIVPVFNPSVRIYEYATPGDTLPPGTVTDYVQYYADVLQANKALELSYVPEYRATEAYNLPNFSTAAWVDFFNRMSTDQALQARYDKYRAVSSEPEAAIPGPPPDTLVGLVFTVVCGVLVLLAGILGWYKCRSFKHKTYEQELAEGLR